MKISKCAVVLALPVCMFATRVGAQVIDQNAPTNNSFMAGFDQCCLAQSFQQANANISGAGIFLKEGIGTSGTVSISLWTQLPDETGAQQLATGSSFGVSGSWFDIFWSPIGVTPNTTYFLVFESASDLGIAGDVSNGYSRGNVFANPGYDSFATYDYTFRTYTTLADATVPEPASVVLLATGLLCLLGVARRRIVS
jgi:hypothetical protein